MQRLILVAAMLTMSIAVTAQHTFKARVIEKGSGEPLHRATVTIESLKISSTTDSAGIVIIKDIPEGKYDLKVSFIGFATWEQSITVPMKVDQITIEMETWHEEEEEVVIQSTRSTRTIQDIPTRVEFVAGEELDEKANMKPGDIRMVLNESTGITTQQTSATSANASIRIQGLDGRYTQVLKDGLPIYAGFSGGLGLLQTPPLDLKQFEGS